MNTTSDTHPLRTLSSSEIESAATLVKPHLSEKATFSCVQLVEPDKVNVMDESSHDKLPRILRFMGYDYPELADGGFDATVDLNTKEILVSRITTGQAPIGFSDVISAIKITKADSAWQAAMRARGITDFDLVQIDAWPTGGFVHESIPPNHRAHRAIAFVREDATDNGYARPVQGLIAHVDLTANKVAYLENHGIVALPPEPGR